MKNTSKKIVVVTLSALAACCTYIALKSLLKTRPDQENNSTTATIKTDRPLERLNARPLLRQEDGKNKPEIGTTSSDPRPKEQTAATELSPAAKKQFNEDLIQVFAQLVPARLQKDLIRPYLQKLNKRGEAGVKAIVDDLTRVPASDQKTLLRMAQVDYLKYRMQWDPSIIAKAEDFLRSPLKESLPNRIKAIVLADKAELVGGIARTDWARAQDIISQINNPLLQKLCVYEAFHGLQGGGASQEQALALVQTIDANFVP